LRRAASEHGPDAGVRRAVSRMRAMILAAGKGERMRPLTLSRPKPLLDVGGEALIEHHLRALAREGFGDVVVNLSWLGEQIPAALGDGSRHGVHLHYSDEGPEPLETGGGIFRALDRLSPGRVEPFLVLNGDVWMEYPYRRLRERFGRALPGDDVAHVVLVPNPAHNPSGDFACRDGRMLEPPDARDAPRWTFSGLGVYSPELFAGCEDGVFKLAPLLRAAARTGRVSAEVFEGEWRDIGTPERLEELRGALATPGGTA
jgi:N-acetyl-alpha-D-muramate 1-phosphate uridylyltransferase